VTTTSTRAPKRTMQSGRSGPHPWPLGSSTCPWTSSRPTRRPPRPHPRPSCPATWRSVRRSSLLAPCHHHPTEHAISMQSATLRCTQMHSISSHERYSDALRCTQIHSLRFTQMHSDAIRCHQPTGSLPSIGTLREAASSGSYWPRVPDEGGNHAVLSRNPYAIDTQSACRGR
jgi:hypothetical protein